MTDEERIARAKMEGVINIYTDDSAYLTSYINGWNQDMKTGREKSKKFHRFEGAFIKVNVLFLLAFVLVAYVLNLSTHTAFEILAIIFITYSIVIIGAIILLSKNDMNYRYEFFTILTLILLIASPLYIILTLLNVIFCIVHRIWGEKLQALEGYPTFSDITIKHVLRGKDEL